jgi:hypothetical protein
MPLSIAEKTVLPILSTAGSIPCDPISCHVSTADVETLKLQAWASVVPHCGVCHPCVSLALQTSLGPTSCAAWKSSGYCSKSSSYYQYMVGAQGRGFEGLQTMCVLTRAHLMSRLDAVFGSSLNLMCVLTRGCLICMVHTLQVDP